MGPWFPRSDDPNKYDFYCASILALLQPWHCKQDLKANEQSWTAAFTSFVTNTTADHKRIIAGIQYYYESKTACDTASTEMDYPHINVHQPKTRVNDVEDMEPMGMAMDKKHIPLTEEDLKQFQ